jgi:hypothetical protein
MADEYGAYKDSSANDDIEWGKVTCVIRFEPGTVGGGGTFVTGGPYIHANSGHIAVGAKTVAVDASGRLVITTDTLGIGTVGSANADEDETLSSLGVQAGISGGNGTLNIKLAQNGVFLDLTQQSAWNIVAGADSNLWITVDYVKARGVGLPSKADQALTQIAQINQRLASIESALESLQQS